MPTKVYENAQYELKGFLMECPDFKLDLLILIFKYLDKSILKEGFSLKMSCLFKTITNPSSRKIYIDHNSFIEMQSLVAELRNKHKSCFDTFVAIIRGYAWNKSDEKIGYCKLARLIIGEPAISVIENNDGLYRFMFDSIKSEEQ